MDRLKLKLSPPPAEAGVEVGAELGNNLLYMFAKLSYVPLMFAVYCSLVNTSEANLPPVKSVQY